MVLMPARFAAAAVVLTFFALFTMLMSRADAQRGAASQPGAAAMPPMADDVFKNVQTLMASAYDLDPQSKMVYFEGGDIATLGRCD